jgi:aminoglycoside phosphotransferase (APT) family kinase protein
MFSESPSWLPDVARAQAAQGASHCGQNVRITRVTGGANNALYRVETGEEIYACKLCVPDDRRRAWREYSALRILETAGVPLAPQPLWLDESLASVPYPVVIYRWVEGETLRLPLEAAQLAALLEGYRRLYAIRPEDHAGAGVLDAWFHWFGWAPYLAELDELLAFYGPWLSEKDPAGPALAARLARLVRRCKEKLLAPETPSPGRAAFPLRLCRVDHNLRNTLRNREDGLRWVDWEYSGWGDPALDLADLRWHATLESLGDEQHRFLRAGLPPPPEDVHFERRLAAWDALLATRWPLIVLRLYWSQSHGSDRLRLTQAQEDPPEIRRRLIRFIERAEET